MKNEPWRPSQWLLTKKCAIENIALFGNHSQYTIQPPTGLAVLSEISPSPMADDVKNKVDQIISNLMKKD